MGGSSSSHQTQSNTINPYQMQQYQQNYAQAGNVADAFQPYTGQLTAGFNPNQTQAQGLLSGIATDPRYAANTQTAIDQTKGVLGQIPNGTLTPQNVAASTYDPAQLKGVDLSSYMNPFQSQVIDASVAQNQYARDQQGVNDNAAATAAHAFGGTRQAVQNANTTAAYDRNNQQNIASLNQANFNQAQQAALSDVAARNQAGQFNAGQTQAAGIFNSGQNLNAQQGTFANTLAALGLKMNAAGQLEALNEADLGRATQQAGILSAVGDTQQQQQQREYTDAYNNYLQNLNIQSQAQQLRNQALGIIPIEQTSTSDQTTKQNPGAMGILGGIASLGLAAATGGSSLGLTGLLGGSVGAGLGGASQMLGSTPFGTQIGSISGNTPGFNYKGIFG